MKQFRVPYLVEWIWLLPLRITWALLIVVWKTLITVLKPILYAFSTPMRPIMAVVNLVTHWAGDNPSKKWGVVFVGSLLISFVTILPFVGWRNDVAMYYFFSLFFHEMLHGLGYSRTKTPYYIVFIGFLGAAAVTSDKNYHTMKHWDKSIMLLLGPLGSLLVALFWAALAFFDPANGQTYMMIGGFNLTLVLFNMVALGGLDGGRVYLTMLASLREDKEGGVMVTMIAVSVVVLVYVFLHSFRFELIIFFLILMIVGFVKTMGKDNPTDYLREPAMKTRQVFLIMLMYIALFTVGAVVYPMFPDWSSLIVIDPFIGNHLPEIIFGLSIIGSWVFAADLTGWMKTFHQRARELVVILLIILFPLVGYILLVNLGVSTVNALITLIISMTLGNLSSRAIFKWKKIYEKILADQPKEIELDPFGVLTETC